MVLRIPGHRIARMGDRVSGGGGNDFVRRWMQSSGGQNGGAPRVLEAEGARPSCWDVREPRPTTSAQHQTPGGCELPFLHPDDAGMESTGEQIRGGQKDK